MKQTWLDIRGAGSSKDAICAEAVNHSIDAIVAADPADLAPLPPGMTKVLMPEGCQVPDDLGATDILVVEAEGHAREVSPRHGRIQLGQFIDVVDPASLERACHSARTQAWSVLRFGDPTKIPLEIVLAAASGAAGRVITVAGDVAEAAVLFGVLERGCDGVMMAPTSIGDASRLKAAASPPSPDLPLVELQVIEITHVGMGERACVDTCTYLRPDEGFLVGSRSRGLVLCVSETHPLPYMPTRPFRVNAGAIMSYTLGDHERTRYLSELCAGATVLAVDAAGHTRTVTVGRVKIETRPLLSIDAIAPDGRGVNLIVQDDWHVRVLGPGGAVLNSTALTAGDTVLGYLPDGDRHVGYRITEFCREQ